MSHQGICEQCPNPRTGRTPRRWMEDCAECLQWIADKHHKETGHHIETRITVEPTADTLRRDIRTAHLIARRRGW